MRRWKLRLKVKRLPPRKTRREIRKERRCLICGRETCENMACLRQG
jgi:hypothetical protein